MSDSTTDRECKACHKSKQLDEFYKRGKYHFWQCKECMKSKARTQVHHDRKVSLVPSEDDVINELHRRGIPALPGKALSHQYADVIAWGCVLIEVKAAKWNGHAFNFPFSAQRLKKRIRGHLVVLVCCYDDHQTYHLFDAANPVFYKDDGRLKSMTQYIPNRKRVNDWLSINTMSDSMMTDAKDRWHMVERWRLDLSDELRKTALPIAA